MAFITADMEQAWGLVVTTTGNTEWVDLVQSATGRYMRFDVAGGNVYSWNRATGVWDNVSTLIGTILAAGVVTPVTVKTV